MKKKIWTSFVFASLLFFLTNIVWSNSFSSSVTIQNQGIKKYKAVRLNAKIINATNPDLSDLLLLNPKNEPVPYFIHRYTIDKAELSKSYALKLINSFIKDTDFYYDYTISEPIKGDMQATSIRIFTGNDNFVKNVTLWGSYDHVNWEKIQTDLLYEVEGKEKLDLMLQGIQKYTFYRFQIANATEKISFSRVEAMFNQEIQRTQYFLESLLPEFVLNNEEELTRISLHGLKNCKLYDIRMETNDMFKRTCSIDGREKVLYQLKFQTNQYQDLSIPLDGMIVTGDAVELLIYNNDDKPIQVTQILVRRYVDEMIFDGSNTEQFILKFGNPKVFQSPRYDISLYRDPIIKEGFDILPVGEIIQAPPPPPPPKPKNYQWLFNTILISVVILIGFVLLIRLRKD